MLGRTQNCLGGWDFLVQKGLEIQGLVASFLNIFEETDMRCFFRHLACWWTTQEKWLVWLICSLEIMTTSCGNHLDIYLFVRNTTQLFYTKQYFKIFQASLGQFRDVLASVYICRGLFPISIEVWFSKMDLRCWKLWEKSKTLDVFVGMCSCRTCSFVRFIGTYVWTRTCTNFL